MKIKFTAPSADQPLFTNVKIQTRDGWKVLSFNGERDGRGKVPAYFFTREEMVAAARKVAA